ncbi:shikimate kinase [Corynebacterium caspium]|uniref:shikimate kinase n=1 Tax=Corynebacterium caspium TaxID=234828 RepID=UPI00035F5BD6|nr:shikimate kinase [Corynebacterium caspium]WKD59203.1 Shikimate kinase [Corynebacterium caspium DSM 44850]
MTADSRPKLVLVGPPGAGKSTVARRVSHALNMPLVDSDLLIEEETGKPCGQVFATIGEPAFRELEARLVAKALRTTGVVSLGGGAVINAETRKLLDDLDVVWLDVSAEEGTRRTSAEDNRPVLSAADPLEHYRNLLASRESFYREVASYRILSDNRSPAQITTQILTWLDQEK